MSRPSTLSIVIRRIIGALPSILGVIIVTFVLTRALPGDPAAYFAGPAASHEAIDQIRETLGLNRSLPEQFIIYVGELLRGDLGNSLTTGQTVVSDLLTRLPASLELTLAGLVFSLTLALPLGILAATRPGSWIDHGVRVLATAGVSLPTFFTGLLLIYVFYFLLGVAPAPLGRLAILYSPPDQITGLFLVDS